jgi:hypothetical protein
LFAGSGVPVRRLGTLVEWLPRESRAAGIARDDPPNAWMPADMLAAVIAEGIDRTNRIMIGLWAKDPPKMDPLEIMWPGREHAEVPKAPASSKADIARFFGATRVRVIDGGNDGT